MFKQFRMNKWVAPIILGVALALYLIFLLQPFGRVKLAEAAPYDMATSTLSFYSTTLPVGVGLRFFAFDVTGTRLMVVDTGVAKIQRFTLNTPFEVSTSSPAININSFDLTTWDSAPRGISFNSTGSRMFIVGGTNKRVNTFSLLSAYDTASTSTSFLYWYDVSAQNPTPRDIIFNNNGTKAFIVSATEGWISTYNLSIPYEFSTSSVSFDHYTSVITQTASPADIRFNGDGSKILVTDFSNARVSTYNLSTPYVIATSTISFDHYYSTPAISPAVGLGFNPDGTKVFMLNGSTLFGTYTNSAAVVVTSTQSQPQPYFFGSVPMAGGMGMQF